MRTALKGQGDIMSKQDDFKVKMSMPYDFKVAYAETRINEFIKECGKRDLTPYVSVGGIDSITLLCFIRSLGYNIDAISVSSLEHKSVRAVHKQLNIIAVKPLKSKYHILKEIGYPVISKDVSQKIWTLQNPTEKNTTYRNAIITGITSRGTKSNIVKLPDKWLDLFYYNNECDIPISNKCCYYLKEKPCQIWAKEHNAVPFLGLQASESRRRFLNLSDHGCNYFSKNSTRSAPFAIFNKSDVIHLAYDLNVPIPRIYGDIIIENNEYKTTGNSRTGCDICGYGIQFEKTRPHRFDRLHDEDFKKWDFWINKMQYGQLFDYIGFNYKYPYNIGDKAWK